MEVTRKQLLAGAAAAGLVAGCGGSPKQRAVLDPGDWASVKAQFVLDPEVRHFDAFVLASHPRPVRAAVERHRRGLDTDTAAYLHAHETELDGRVAAAAARYLDVQPGDLAFTDSTTMGLGLVYGGVRVDGEVVSTEHDFYATHEALRLRFGRFRQIRLYDDPASATADAIVEAVKRGIGRRAGRQHGYYRQPRIFDQGRGRQGDCRAGTQLLRRDQEPPSTTSSSAISRPCSRISSRRSPP